MELDGERIRQLRLDRFWSQVDLANEANLTESTVNRLELGRQRARISTVKRLADALGVAPASLLAQRNGDQAGA